MAKLDEPYRLVVVESYPETGSGLHGKVHIRPLPGGPYPVNTRVECPREMRDVRRYKLGTKFRIKVKLTDREGGGEFLYSHHSWPFEVLP